MPSEDEDAEQEGVAAAGAAVSSGTAGIAQKPQVAEGAAVSSGTAGLSETASLAASGTAVPGGSGRIDVVTPAGRVVQTSPELTAAMPRLNEFAELLRPMVEQELIGVGEAILGVTNVAGLSTEERLRQLLLLWDASLSRMAEALAEAVEVPADVLRTLHAAARDTAIPDVTDKRSSENLFFVAVFYLVCACCVHWTARAFATGQPAQHDVALKEGIEWLVALGQTYRWSIEKN